MDRSKQINNKFKISQKALSRLIDSQFYAAMVNDQSSDQSSKLYHNIVQVHHMMFICER